MAQIPQQSVDSALQILSALEPLPLALYWEYQDAATTVLFVVNVADQSASSVEQTYFKQLVPSLCALIPDPETGPLPSWMVVFQNQASRTITACCSQDMQGAL